MPEKENIFKPIVKTEDKLFFKDFKDLAIINILFVYINISNLDKNKFKNYLINFLLFILLFYLLDNNL